MLDLLQETLERLIAQVDLSVKRSLYNTITISRLVGLIGPRGVGKTTLMLQYIKEHYYKEKKAFYFSADFVYFRQTTLLEFIDSLYKYEGYRIFFIDEIHQYKNWSQELKNIYDAYPDIKIMFSGSSMLDLMEGSHDLSRRVHLYHLPGLSFREYLVFAKKLHFPPISFDLLVKEPKNFAELGHIDQILQHFKTFLEVGYYPFLFEEPLSYHARITQIIKKIIFEDIPSHYDLKTANLHHFMKLLGYLASIPPGEVNINSIAQNLSLAHQTTEHYLHILESVGLIQLIYPFEGGGQYLRKPQKIFIHNTTLLNVLQAFVGTELNKGTLRELFFLQSLRDAGQTVFYSKHGDYRVKDAVFEIGGKNKSDKQIVHSEFPGYIVKDDILQPSKKNIPLFYFGFLN